MSKEKLIREQLEIFNRVMGEVRQEKYAKMSGLLKSGRTKSQFKMFDSHRIFKKHRLKRFSKGDISECRRLV